MEHAEKELQEVREEAERQKVGVVEVNTVPELEAELSQLRAQLVQLQGSHPDTEIRNGPNVKRPCLQEKGEWGFRQCPPELSACVSKRPQISTTHSSTEIPVVFWNSPQCQTGAIVRWK